MLNISVQCNYNPNLVQITAIRKGFPVPGRTCPGLRRHLPVCAPNISGEICQGCRNSIVHVCIVNLKVLVYASYIIYMDIYIFLIIVNLKVLLYLFCMHFTLYISIYILDHPLYIDEEYILNHCESLYASYITYIYIYS